MKIHQMTSQRLLVLFCFVLLAGGHAQAYPEGIGGDADGEGDVSLAGCTCHAEIPDNAVTIILEGVPYHYLAGSTYHLKIQIIGGPEIDTSAATGGFAMSVSQGSLSGGEGFEDKVQNWEEDLTTLTHTASGSKTEDRAWHIIWSAPPEESGIVTFALAGNAVNGDGAPSDLDRWNRLTTSVGEGEDDGRTRTIFSGNGEINPPAPVEEGVDLHHMGAKLRAHWLGLLGFGAVILVIVFCGLFLRYGFSRHYKGRSNLLRLRIKHLKRGDQL